MELQPRQLWRPLLLRTRPGQGRDGCSLVARPKTRRMVCGDPPSWRPWARRGRSFPVRARRARRAAQQSSRGESVSGCALAGPVRPRNVGADVFHRPLPAHDGRGPPPNTAAALHQLQRDCAKRFQDARGPPCGLSLLSRSEPPYASPLLSLLKITGVIRVCPPWFRAAAGGAAIACAIAPRAPQPL